MELTPIFGKLLKYIIMFFVTYVIYLLYIALVKPLVFWFKYRKYPNVHVNKYFIPLLGDLYYHVKDMNEGRVHYHHKVEQAKVTKDYDLKVKLEGLNPILLIESNKALEEFVALQPHIIDRGWEYKGLTKCVPDGFINARTTTKTHEQRKLFTSLLNLNQASKYTSGMIDCCEELLDSMDSGNTYDFMFHMNAITFNILTNVLFGDDVKELRTRKEPFTTQEGVVKDMNLCEALLMVANCFLFQLINPVTTMFPFINKHDLINPYKRDRANHLHFNDMLKNLIDKSKDTKSVSYQVFKDSKCSKNEIFEDLVTFMVAGSETSARTMVSMLYYMKKNPEVLAKVKEELKEHGITRQSDFRKDIDMNLLQNLEYMTCVIKEALRIDSPTFESFTYTNYDDVKICNVPIPKGTVFKIDICSAHFYENCWLRPKEFIPERFDMDSEFYKESKKSCPDMSNYARRAFSHGKRACPGQTLAYLEIKIIVAYIITHIDYDIDEEFLNKEGVGFGLGSQIIPKFKITKV